MSLPVITIGDIRAAGPCYDPTRYLPEGWTGTIVDILEDERIPEGDRVWVAQALNYALDLRARIHFLILLIELGYKV